MNPIRDHRADRLTGDHRSSQPATASETTEPVDRSPHPRLQQLTGADRSVPTRNFTNRSSNPEFRQDRFRNFFAFHRDLAVFRYPVSWYWNLTATASTMSAVTTGAQQQSRSIHIHSAVPVERDPVVVPKSEPNRTKTLPSEKISKSIFTAKLCERLVEIQLTGSGIPSNRLQLSLQQHRSAPAISRHGSVAVPVTCSEI